MNNCLEVVVGGEVLEEVTLLLHDAVELVNVVLTELLSNTGEVAEGDLVGVVVIEELEHLLDVLAGILLAHLASHHREELGELDGAVAVVVDVGDHLLELLVLDLEAEGAHGGLKLADIDGAGGVGVEEGERLTDLVKLLLGELTGLLLTTTTRHIALDVRFSPVVRHQHLRDGTTERRGASLSTTVAKRHPPNHCEHASIGRGVVHTWLVKCN